MGLDNKIKVVALPLPGHPLSAHSTPQNPQRPREYAPCVRHEKVTAQQVYWYTSNHTWTAPGSPPPMGEFAGPFIKDKNSIKTTYAHQNCIMWCPEVYFCAKLERLKHVEEAIKRGKQLKCSHCGKKGAAVGCTLPSCNRTYHLKCAHACGARFNAEKFIVTCPIHKSAKKTPAPMWSKTMNGDEALNEATTNAMTAPTVAGENTGATPLLERLAKGAGPAPNASGRPVTRKATELNFDEIDENERTELGFNRPKKGMSKLERTRGVIASVVAANERVKAEKEKLNDDEAAFAKREKSRTTRDKGKIDCITVGGSFGGGSSINGGLNNATQSSIGGFETLAGMEPEIKVLKELALLPLTYPDVFKKLGVAAGRGVLLHGPPGTGKTAVVRALLGAAAKGPHPVSFFSRKGADALGKYMGEAERSLRLLFSEAQRRQPSIIFFDEIDGLAPARKKTNAEGDAIHGSVVASLLALMDGLDDRGQVVVIAATNRPDAVDPALRRPGRFDREIRFALPGPSARVDILKVHTKEWVPRPNVEILQQIADRTEGAAGADLRALASAATLAAVRRRAPSLLNGDATRESLSAALEPYLPEPKGYQTLKETASEIFTTQGHLGAKLALKEMRALGTRVEIFWSGNAAFFPGTVTAFDKAKFAHRVTYDDGETQWLTLWREGEVVRWVDDETVGTADEAVAMDVSAPGAATPPQLEKTTTPSSVPNTASKRAAEALAAAEATAAASTAASTRVLTEIFEKRTDTLVVSCKRKFGVFLPKKLKASPETEVTRAEKETSAQSIVCLCASCVSSDAQPYDPRRWETHCGAGNTKKWKHTVRLELVHTTQKKIDTSTPSVSIPIGRWFEMNCGKNVSIEDALKQTQAKNLYAAQVGANSVNTGDNDDNNDDIEDLANFDVPFDVEVAKSDALHLLQVFETAEAAAKKRGGGFKVNANDWAHALAMTTGPCSRRSASGGALAPAANPLDQRLVPVLGEAACSVLVALRDARLPLDVFASKAADTFSSWVDKSGNRSPGDWQFAEQTLQRAGLLDGGVRGATRGGKGGSNVDSVSEESDEEETWGDTSNASRAAANQAAAAAAAAAVSGTGRDGKRPRSLRLLVSGDGQGNGQKHVIACALHALQGVPCRALSLASLIAEGEGDASVGVVKSLREPLRCAARAPSLLHVSGLETWAVTGVTVEDSGEEDEAGDSNDTMDVDSSSPQTIIEGVAPSHLWDIFEQTICESEAGSGEDGCLLVLADSALPLSALPDRIQRFFGDSSERHQNSSKEESGVRLAHAGGAGADATQLSIELKPPTDFQRARVIARGAASITRCAVAPALSKAAAMEIKARWAKEADAEAATASKKKRRREDDAIVSEKEKDKNNLDTQSAAQEWRRLEKLRSLNATLASRKKASFVLSQKAKMARDCVRRGVAATATTIAATPRFKPAFKEPPTKSNRNKFRAVVVAGAQGEFGSCCLFLDELRKSAGKLGLLQGNKPNKWGVLPQQATHVPSDHGAAVSAALDTAAAMLLSPSAVRDEKVAEEAEATAAAARQEVAKAAKEVAAIVVEGVGTVGGDDSLGGIDQLITAEPVPGEELVTAEAHAVVPATPATPRIPKPGNIHPSSTMPSAKALQFKTQVTDLVRLAGPSNEDIAKAAAALAELVVRKVDIAIKGKRNEDEIPKPGLGSIDTLLGTVAGVLTHCARNSGGAVTCVDLLHQNREAIERACVACVEE